MMMNNSNNNNQIYLTLLAMILILGSHHSNAFSMQPIIIRQTTQLNAWSIPSMPIGDMSVFTSQQLPNLDTSWYTVSNPSPRKVYEDVPHDYTLMSAGTNWPSMDASSEKSTGTQQQQQQRIGPLTPIRRAARWARNIRR